MQGKDFATYLVYISNCFYSCCSLENLGSLISQFGFLKYLTWHLSWVVLVIWLYTGCTGSLYTWILGMLLIQVTMCAMWRISKTVGSRLMTVWYVLISIYLHILILESRLFWFLNVFLWIYAFLISGPSWQAYKLKCYSVVIQYKIINSIIKSKHKS